MSDPATRQFLVMVDGSVGDEDLFRILRSGFPDSLDYRRVSMRLRDNLLEINENEGADPERAATDEDDFLYYRWRVEVTPADEGISEDHQVDLARNIVRITHDAGLRAVVCAAFEDRI